MVASLIRRGGASLSVPMWLSALCAALAPTSIGYQDLAALFARQPGVSQRWHEHMIASPFGTIHAATFRFARPIGTAVPEPLASQPVNFDPRSLDVKVLSADEIPMASPAIDIAYPTVNRRLKGDRMPLPQVSPQVREPASLPQLQPIDTRTEPQPARPPASVPRLKDATQHDSAPPPAAARARVAPKQAQRGGPLNAVAAAPAATNARSGPPPAAITAPVAPTQAIQQGEPLKAVVAAPAATSARSEPPPAAIAASVAPTQATQHAEPSNAIAAAPAADNERSARTSDGESDAVAADKPPEIPAASESDAIDATPSSPSVSLSFLEEDAAERNSQLYFGSGALGSRAGLEQWAPGAEPILVSPTVDPDIKLSALEGPAEAGPGGETVAGKDDLHILQTPAERLKLEGKSRAKAEKCLADAVYFEARGEPLRGQEAVAQVVMNRVFSGYYPNDVCGVVYQNANRHLACQFTFACEGKDLDRIDEPDMWEQAKRIARDTLDGKIWLTEVGHATHYHAYWVHPSWVHEMAKLYKLGVHTFYRPRAWGDGSDAPVWGGTPAVPQSDGPAGERPEAAKEPGSEPKSRDAAAKVPEAAAAPAQSKTEPTAKL